MRSCLLAYSTHALDQRHVVQVYKCLKMTWTLKCQRRLIQRPSLFNRSASVPSSQVYNFICCFEVIGCHKKNSGNFQWQLFLSMIVTIIFVHDIFSEGLRLCWCKSKHTVLSYTPFAHKYRVYATLQSTVLREMKYTTEFIGSTNCSSY